MLKATVNGEFQFDLTEREGDYYVGEEKTVWDCRETAGRVYSILMGDKSFTAELLGKDAARKTVTLRVNGREYEVTLEGPLDQLLKTMGIRNGAARKANEIRAPMPGLVLKVLVIPGQAVRKGDPVLVLEAMKMENVFRAATDGVVKTVCVPEKTAVEKGQPLLVLE